MMMKKISIIFLALVVIFTLFAGCSGCSNKGAEGQGTEAERLAE
jgi:hypothetical protein